MSVETASNVFILNKVIFVPQNPYLHEHILEIKNYFILLCFIFGTVMFKNYENSYNQKFMEKRICCFHTSLGPVSHLLLEWNSPSCRTKLTNVNKVNPSNFFQTKCLASQNQPISVLKQNNCFLHLISTGTLPAKSLQKWPHCVYPPLNDCCLAVSLQKTVHNRS